MARQFIVKEDEIVKINDDLYEIVSKEEVKHIQVLRYNLQDRIVINNKVYEIEKMSKSRGNIVEPFTAMRENGADTVRFYLPYVSPVWTPLKFDEDGIKEVQSKFFNTLKNTYTFFQMYANTDNVDPRSFEVKYEEATSKEYATIVCQGEKGEY